MKVYQRVRALFASMTGSSVSVATLLGRETKRFCPWPVAAPAISSSGMVLTPQIISEMATRYDPKVELAPVRFSDRGNPAHWTTGPAKAYVERLYADPVAESTMTEAEFAEALFARAEAVHIAWEAGGGEAMTQEAEAALIASTAVDGMPTVLWASVAGVKYSWGGDGFSEILDGNPRCSIGAYVMPGQGDDEWRFGHLASLGTENPAVVGLPPFPLDKFASDAQPFRPSQINTTPAFAISNSGVLGDGRRWLTCALNWSVETPDDTSKQTADEKPVYADPAAGEPANEKEVGEMALSPEDLKAIGDMMDSKIADALKKEDTEETPAAMSEDEMKGIVETSRNIARTEGLVEAMFAAGRLTQSERDSTIGTLELAAEAGPKGVKVALEIYERLAPKAKPPSTEKVDSFIALLSRGSKAEVTNPEVTTKQTDERMAFSTLSNAAKASKDPAVKAAMLTLANKLPGIATAGGN